MEPPTIGTTLYTTVLCPIQCPVEKKSHKSFLQSTKSNPLLAIDLPHLGCEARAKDAYVGSHASPPAGTSYLPPYCCTVNYSKPPSLPTLLYPSPFSFVPGVIGSWRFLLEVIASPHLIHFPSRRLVTPSVVSSFSLTSHIPTFPCEIFLFWLRARCIDD